MRNWEYKEHKPMATIAAPRSRARIGRKMRIWIGVILGLVLVCGVAGVLIRNALSAAQAATGAGWQAEPVKTGTIDAAVSATGNIEPRARADLRFVVDGTVTEILV